MRKGSPTKATSKILALMLCLAMSLAFAGSYVQTPGQAPVQAHGAADKKAIYILPGYAESRLYGTNGGEIWASIPILEDIALDATGQCEMAHDTNGLNMLAKADRSRDPYGILNCFLPMANSLGGMLRDNGLDGVYTVEFFSYNWLDDLNVVAKDLASDIARKGYTKIILITHSNGGLLGSVFVAQSAANRNKIERAILIAPPLYGTYTALEPIETGAMTLFDGTLFNSLLQAFYSPFIYPISQHWVKSWAKNSPNTYQLLPSQEYLNRIPAIWKNGSGTQFITKMSDLWALMNKSPNVNPKLTNSSSNKSEKYFRETALGGDILAQWSKLNCPVTLMGCESGFMTPLTPVYRTTGTKTFYEGAIYTFNGDALVPGFSAKGDGRFEYLNFSNSGHVALLADSRVLKALNLLILGQQAVGSAGPGTSMFDMARLIVTSDIGLALNVIDPSGKTVATAKGEMFQGFDTDRFAYECLAPETDGGTKMLVCLPKKGYKVQLSAISSPLASLAAKTQVNVFELDKDGFFTSRNQYDITGCDLTGLVVCLDNANGKNPTFTPTMAKFTKSLSVAYDTDWNLSSLCEKLEKGKSLTLTLTGSDVANGKVKPSSLIWSSSNTAIATVSASGVVKAISPGNCYIIAMKPDDSFRFVECALTVTAPVSGVTLSPASATLPAGSSIELLATVSPDSAIDKTVSYRSSNAAVATVSPTGLLTAIAPGSVTITVTTNSGSKTATCRVTVVQPVSMISLSPSNCTIAKGKTQALTASLLPTDATLKTVEWTTGNDSVASVSASGVIAAKGSGSTTITCTAKDGSGAFAVCEVTVP